MAHIKKSVSIDEGIDFWLRHNAEHNPDFKSFSDVTEKMITKGIQQYEREKIQSIQEQTGRHGQGKTGSSMHGLPPQSADDLENMPEMRRSGR